jgi:membrane protease YdiL (CAAX protease family)
VTGPTGPRGIPAVTWRLGEAILIWLAGNLGVGLVVAVVVFSIAGVDAADDVGEGVASIVATLIADVAFVGVIVGWLSARHKGWVAALGIPERGRWLVQVGWGALGGLLLYPAILVVAIPLQIFFQLFSEASVSTPEQVPSDLSSLGKVLTVVLAVVVAPVTEELFYRGVLFRSVRDRHGFWPGALASAALFGLVHYVPAPWQDFMLLQSIMVVTGIGLAWIYEWRGTIVSSIAAHMVFNIIGITFILGSG